MHWTTKTTYVDVNTGEEITKKVVEKKLYIKLKCKITNERKSDTYGIRHINWRCEKNRQPSLF